MQIIGICRSNVHLTKMYLHVAIHSSLYLQSTNKDATAFPKDASSLVTMLIAVDADKFHGRQSVRNNPTGELSE